MYVSVVCMSICLCMDRGHTLCLVLWNSVSSLSLELINPAPLVVRHLLWECLPALPAPALLGLQTPAMHLSFMLELRIWAQVLMIMSEHLTPRVVSLDPYWLEISFFGEGFPVSLVWVLIALAGLWRPMLASSEATMMTILMCVFVNKKKKLPS